MKKTKITELRNQDPSVRSYTIRVETHDDKFHIPVVDVRDGEKAREKADAILKSRRMASGSKYFSQSYSLLGYTYNTSMKPTEI